jgi:hypothetical protein
MEVLRVTAAGRSATVTGWRLQADRGRPRCASTWFLDLSTKQKASSPPPSPKRLPPLHPCRAVRSEFGNVPGYLSGAVRQLIPTSR